MSDTIPLLRAMLAVRPEADDERFQDHAIGMAVSEIERLTAENEALRKALKDCADDLESFLENEYHGILHYPSMKADYDRDMKPVLAARGILSKKPENIDTSGGHVEGEDK